MISLTAGMLHCSRSTVCVLLWIFYNMPLSSADTTKLDPVSLPLPDGSRHAQCSVAGIVIEKA